MVGVRAWCGASHVVANRAHGPTLNDGRAEPLPTCRFQSWVNVRTCWCSIERSHGRSVLTERTGGFGVARFGFPRTFAVAFWNVGHSFPFKYITGELVCRPSSALWARPIPSPFRAVCLSDLVEGRPGDGQNQCRCEMSFRQRNVRAQKNPARWPGHFAFGVFIAKRVRG